MNKHFIHFNRRQVRLLNLNRNDKLWFAEKQSPLAGFERPQYHITRAVNGPAAEINEGDTIWLIGQLYSPWGKLPPAVDARIDVGERLELKDNNGNLAGFRYEAAPASRWFPLADVSTALDSLRTRRQDGKAEPLRKKPAQPIGQLLQRIRKLESGEPLIDWENALDENSFDFVSYRILDGTRAAFEKVKSLVDAGKAVFWDRWSLPRRLAERREFLSDEALEKYIEEQLKRAKIVWAINSPLYGKEESYSAREMLLGQKLGTYRPG